MSARLANRSQFSFNGTTYAATSVSVEAPQPEIVDMTSLGSPLGDPRMVPTGDVTAPGRISVEAFGFANPASLVGTIGLATFTTPLGSVSKRAICDSASVEGQVADLLRVRFSLTMTSYQGT
jgi:hypothetical protein